MGRHAKDRALPRGRGAARVVSRRSGFGPTCLPGRRGDDRVGSPGDGDRTPDLSRPGRCYLRRIDAYDKNGPALNAIVLVNPEALQDADQLDRALRAGRAGRAAALHSGDRQGQLRDDRAAERRRLVVAERLRLEQDAFLVKRIKDAGAIVLAKSNMAEFAFSPYETVNSLLPGYTRNPYALDRVTAGSSGGTAAAIAANFGAIGLGSDTGNSIRGPSSHQALVGIRSTMGLTSRAGVVPLNLLADIAGPMTRTVADAVAVFQAIVGEDPDDPTTAAAMAAPFRSTPESLSATGSRAHALASFIRPIAATRPTRDVETVFGIAIEDLKHAGATIVDTATVDLDQVRRVQDIGPCGGFKYDINRYLAAHVRRRRRCTRWRRSSGRATSTRQSNCDFSSRRTVTENGPDTPACRAEQEYREQFRGAVQHTMDSATLDAFVYPTWSNPPRLIGDLNTPHGDNSQVFAPTTGWPAINVPMGYTRGTLPIGLTFFGRAWSEPTLIKLAYAYEQSTRHRRPPASVPPLK